MLEKQDTSHSVGIVWGLVIRLFSWDILLSGAVAGCAFVALGLVFYFCYGWDFLEQAYLYHLTQRDIRHNFSPYFYMLYLTVESEWSLFLGLAAFLPQILLLFVLSFTYYKDLVFCSFPHTAVFVSVNKVCTSSYLLWYFSLLPPAIPFLRMSWQRAAFLLLLWLMGQALWLVPVYFWEFEGQDTFLLMWLAGLLFLFANGVILVQILVHYCTGQMVRKIKLQ